MIWLDWISRPNCYHLHEHSVSIITCTNGFVIFRCIFIKLIMKGKHEREEMKIDKKYVFHSPLTLLYNDWNGLHVGRSVMVPCKQGGCKCKAFAWIPSRPEDVGEFWHQRRRDFDPSTWRAKCRCKHTHEEHDPTGMRRCKSRGRESIFEYCKTLIIYVTLFSQGHHPWFIHETLFFGICNILFYYPYIRNYWWRLYFHVLVLSWIYAKINSSQIKRVLE